MLRHCGNNHGTFFSLLFPLSGSKHSTNNTSSYDNDTDNIFGSSTVDCTLSLGTPSTRHAETSRTRPHGSQQRVSCASSVSWDVVSTESNGYNKQLNNSAGLTKETDSSTRLTRRCANCDATSTPLWRNGPRGPKVCMIY
jgi:GATA zinc finger